MNAFEEAHNLAVAHLDDCIAAAFDDDSNLEDPSCAPYCGCTICIVREVIHAAYPKLREHILQNDNKQETL